MDFNRVTSNEQRQLLAILQRAAGLMTAAAIAKRMNLPGCRETQRRRVRAIIQGLRETAGAWIIGLPSGYWLTDSELMWMDYLNERDIDAKRILAESHRRARQLEPAGQGLLFAGVRA